MYRSITILALVLLSGTASAHDMTPTYPEMTPSHLRGVVKTTLHIFNKREEIEYYQFGVFDNDFNPIPFVSPSPMLRVPYLQHAETEIYIRRSNLEQATYICSESKLRRDSEIKTRISSRICSKIKK
jgi:hypothetical protein